MTKQDMINLVTQTFKEVGIDPAIGCAIIEHESNWNPEAHSPAGAADDKYGGAWGLAQFLPITAKRLGYEGPPEGLLDPAINIHLLAELTAENAKLCHSKDIIDLAAMHNSGRPFNRAPFATTEFYVAPVVKLYHAWRARLLEEPAALAQA